MINALIILIEILLSLFSFAFLVFMLIVAKDSISAKVPFVTTKSRAISTIIKSLQLSPNSVLYDIGCGDSRVLLAAISAFPKIKAIGIEKGVSPFIISLIKTARTPIKILFADYKDISLTEATHIYCYLSNEEMDRVAEKTLQECKKGTRIVSCDFKISKWKPIKVIDLQSNGDKLSKKIFVYEVKNSMTQNDMGI